MSSWLSRRSPPFELLERMEGEFVHDCLESGLSLVSHGMGTLTNHFRLKPFGVLVVGQWPRHFLVTVYVSEANRGGCLS
jgi:hypothetical protein